MRIRDPWSTTGWTHVCVGITPMVAAPRGGPRARYASRMSDFDAAFSEFLDEFFRIQPVLATASGEHRHDGEWPDATDAGRLARLDAADRWTARLEALTGLSADEAIDRDLVVGELAAARFAEAELREDAWNPLEWVYLLGEGIFTLIAREFAPLPERLTSVASRLEGLPAVLDGAREALVGIEGRPVGRFQTEAALRQLPGIAELIDDAVGEADARRGRRGGRCAQATAGGGGRDRQGGARRLRGAPARHRPARERRGGSAGPRPLRPQDAPHDALRRAHRGPCPGRRRTRVPTGPRGDGPHRPRPVADLVRRPVAPR